jgi:hypothetical protein
MEKLGMNRVANIGRLAASLLLVGGAVVACSGGAEPASEQTSEAIVIPHPPSQPPVPPNLCKLENLSCFAWQRTDAGYSEAYVRNPAHPGVWYEQVQGFSAAMTAAGCLPEIYEVTDTTDQTFVVPRVIAYCPTVPAYTSEIGCDACIFAPAGYVAVTWLYSDPNLLPGPSCDLQQCVSTFHY